MSEWTRKSFPQEQKRIDLFVVLIRKNINALLTFPLNPSFSLVFSACCKQFDRLEKEYKKGLSDRIKWAKAIDSIASKLTSSIQ